MTYESRLAVDLCTWTFQILVDAASLTKAVYAAKIPDCGILEAYAHGRKQLSLQIDCDMVDIPAELFQTLLWEIFSCQQTLRSEHGRRSYRQND
jgi:hypothetical protein